MIWETSLVPFPLSVTIADKLWMVGALIIILVAFQCAVAALDIFWRAAHAGSQRVRETRLLKARLDSVRKRRDAEQQEAAAWSGWRKFKVSWRVPESGDVCSFYLKPHDEKALPPFKPGQFLTFRLDIPGQPKPVIRCYSLSDCMHEDYYRVSIKRVGQGKDGKPGLGSCYFHDRLKEGEIVDVKAPGGGFFLDRDVVMQPVVLLSSGIGVTPVLSMLNALVKGGSLDREVYFIYGVRNSSDHSFRQHLAQLAQIHEKLHLHICYSRPFDHEVSGTDYHTKGHVSIDVLKKVLPSNNFHFYLCGTSAMMETMITELKTWGVPEAHIHSEAFGPSSGKAIGAATGAIPPPAAAEAGKAAEAVSVQFARTGRTEMWKAADGTLLEFAEHHGVAIDSNCRAGNCGSCSVAIKKGDVTYQKKPGWQVETGSCLTCCSVPKGELILDA